ncbi:Vtc5p Ecym_7221 [Eremothecium cymbalariae DBVPG|uniref:SPX domain-containing protein n=1 Tax=Eremothecium cymbalariae (strain CBS 270.75 / DBVPG 7215 / KCTC 17166 / NRRL Y-17582) TaxID=931890 RepID=G8JW52_ERECY|nr:hypothetical protein Ecym_7221 [Eremothecium cymbalariae DBVPG\
MKFGTHILIKCVPEWKLNNIDYGKLKRDIKQVTTFNASRKCYAGNGEENDGEREENEELLKLYESFEEQFHHVNLFVSLKVKEVGKRLMTIESTILQWDRKAAMVEGRRYPKLSMRVFKTINKNLDHCSLDLQRLARYLILQKTALRKLIKKFLRYYPYDEADARQFVSKLLACDELQSGHEGISFMQIDLSPYLLQVSLIVGVLYDLERKAQYGDIQESKADGDERTLTRTDTLEGKYGIKSSIVEVLSRHVDSCLTFDNLFWAKFEPLQKLLVPQENVDEMKFLLLNLGYQVIDDTLISTSKQIIHNTVDQTRRLGDENGSLLERNLSLESLTSFDDVQAGAKMSSRSSSRRRVTLFSKQTRTLSQSKIEMFLIDTKYTKGVNSNSHPSLLVQGEKKNSCLLLCHTTGFRNYISTQTLPLDIALKALSHKADQTQQKLQLSPLDKACLDWVESYDAKLSDIAISAKRTRFLVKREVTIDGKASTCVYLITLDEGVTINNSIQLPHAFLEMRMLADCVSTPLNGLSQVDKELIKLIDSISDNSFSCFPLASSHTLWNVANQLKKSTMDTVSNQLYNILINEEIDDCELSPILQDEFFELGQQRLHALATPKLPKSYNSYGNTSQNTPNIDTSSKGVENENRHILRYWNEFDNDESIDQNGFYVDSNFQSFEERREQGFIKFDKAFILSFYQYINQMNRFFSKNNNKIPIQNTTLQSIEECPATQCELDSLVQSRNGVSYASLETQDSMSSSVNQHSQLDSFWSNEQIFDLEAESNSLYEYKHDKVVSMFYLTTLLVSCITTGTTFGIMFSLFSVVGGHETEFDGTIYITALILSSLILSLTLSSFSLLLLFSRYRMAPWWHYTSCIVIFILITFCVCYGLISMFF